jgi:uncharacterized protein YndB with AHSA1/START domain
MKRLLRYLSFALIGLVAAFLVASAIGLLLPRRHVAASSLVVHRPAEDVWVAITDIGSQSQWRTDLNSAERLADHDGRPVWLQRTDMGDWTLELTRMEQPSLLVATVADSTQGFGGAWTYEIDQDDERTVLRITERGFIDPPLFRFLARFVFGLHGSQQTYLEDLSHHLGEKSRPKREI